MIAGLLPILCLALCIALAATYVRSWRESVIAGGVVWGVCLVAITELLSLFTAIRVVPVAIAWTLLGAATATLIASRRTMLPEIPSFARLSLPERIGVAWLALAFALLCALAIYVPPNSFDGLAYHLPRVLHWIQNESVRHYPTNIARQDWMSPFAEYAMLHLHLLSGSDRLDNLVQWMAMLGSVVGVTRIAARLGAPRRGQWFAAILCATMPMGILAATSSKNDYVAAFWLVCAVYALLALRDAGRRGEYSARNTTLFGASVGLALLTKGTAYVFVLPFIVWFVLDGLMSPRRLLEQAVLAAAIAVLINAPFFARNVATFGRPLGPPAKDGATTMLLLAPRAFASNVTKISITEISTGYRFINRRLEAAAVVAHRLMHEDIMNPGTTFAGHPFQIWQGATQEYIATNLQQIIVLLVAILALLARRAALSRDTGPYGAALVAGFLLFCAVVKWQPWISRLTLPLFVLVAPLSGVLLSFVPRQRLITLAAVLAVVATPWLLFNLDKPVLGPESVFAKSRGNDYFPVLRSRYSGYLRATSYVKSRGCSDVGLAVGGSGWEYILWKLLNESPTRIRISHYGVQNVTRTVPREPRGASPHPCAVIRTKPLWRNEAPTEFPGYTIGEADSEVQVYIPVIAASPE